jgi:hypothetical protein
MKLGSNAFAVIAGLALAAPAFAGSWADGMFEESSCDFGAVPRGPTMNHHFRIKNNTGKTVTIGNVRVSCGCTQARALKTKLEAGEESAVFAQMDTSRFSGSRTVTIFVRVDEPQYEEVHLKVTANSREDLSINPDTVDFGQIKTGSDATKTAKVVLTTGGQDKILEVTSESSFVQPSVKEVKRGNGSVEYELTLKVQSDIPAGKWYTTVWMKTSNKTLSRISVPVMVEASAK